MADFRRVSVGSLKWFPQSRKSVPVTPIRVQTPPCPCSITLLPGRYGLELTLSGHPSHAAFVGFLRAVEAHAREHARPTRDDLRWYACTDADSLIPTFRLSAFDDVRFYDRDGLPHACPTDFEACSCLLELAGAWTTDTAWGLRWKVLEVKRAVCVPVTCLLMESDDELGAPTPCMFVESDDEQGDVVGTPCGACGDQLAQHVQPAIDARKPGHLGEPGDEEHQGHQHDRHDDQRGLVG